MLVTLANVAILAAAIPSAQPDLEVRQTSQCNVGTVNCCNSAEDATSTEVTELASTIGLDLTGIAGLVGFGCSAITGLGIGDGSTCTTNPVCCEKNAFDGLIGLGCVPITL
ncbi:hypothetical protein JAAARDRAFT_125640 [Jaapia argillacea MUCL 33604]|uniref:Hydrophobin n=1 Tax=Jaapia argillacea MUCL 33604 TaxID=933084 RepID=A0A067Q2V6_9AGAM|nr:hypothetical protein JAAARDRAFT_125640 [Jaapia argillacea MUCL 33604]